MNSETGLPRTILGIAPSDRFAVTEMGMCNLGEIRVLTKIAKPNVAVITNIGFCHLENLRTRENILKAKLEILEGLAENGTTMLIVTHELSFAQRVATNTMFMHNGAILESAPTKEFFTHPKQEETLKFLSKSIPDYNFVI